MKIEVNLKKKYFFSLLTVLIVLSGALIVYAYNSSPADASKFGHSANELEVNIGGTNYTLQQAISQGLIGGSAITPSFYTGTLSSGTATNTKNIGKHSFCAMSLSSNADDQQLWATGICNIAKDANSNWTITTSATNGYYNCNAVCFDSTSGTSSSGSATVINSGAVCEWKSVGVSGMTFVQYQTSGATGACYFQLPTGVYRVGSMGQSNGGELNVTLGNFIMCDEDSYTGVYTDYQYYSCK